ncbi:MAG: hypothetical protein QGG50_01935 [Methanopyri archaeon]|jgi:hypothetical protein|nr:hypothetical protein [Methanopyri archaeon]
MGERSNAHLDVEDVIGLITRSFEGKRTIEVKNLRGGTFTATLVGSGIEVSNLGEQAFLPWDVFTETVGLLRENGGKALKGDAMSSRLGEIALPIDSVEGRIAFRVYGKGAGESVFPPRTSASTTSSEGGEGSSPHGRPTWTSSTRTWTSTSVRP